jgi:putative membrane protein
MWDGRWFGWMFFGPLMMILFIAVAAAVVVLVVRSLGGTGSRSGRQPDTSAAAGPRPTPLDILKERLAKGEIDGEEFERRRRLLQE